MDNKLLATVNGREIRESDLNGLLQGLGQNAIQFSNPEGRAKLIDELVMQELLHSEAIEKGYDKEQEFLTVFENMKSSLVKQYAMNKLLTSITVSDEYVKEYYEKHKDMYSQPEAARASHILVSTEEEANEILAEINNGLDFAEAAQKYSSCPSKSAGGDLGEFTKGRMVPEFEKATFEMNVGEISEPVKTQFGYHIIKLVDKKEPKKLSFEEVKDQVKNQCLAVKQNTMYLEKGIELKKKYAVEHAE